MGNIIAIDGGGTKTLGVLYTKDGKELRRTIKGMCNISVDFDLSILNLINTIQDLICDFSTNDIEIIQIGLAGYINQEITQKIEQQLYKKFGIPCNVVLDADIALYSIKKTDLVDTVLIIGGTGSIIAYEYEDNIKYIGGYGHLLGDEGSAYHLVINSIKKLLLKLEENNIPNRFDKELLKIFNCEYYRDIIQIVYSNQKNQIANYAIEISNLALKGYLEAIELFKEEGLLLANQIMKTLNMNRSGTIKLGFRGSFIHNAPYVKEELLSELKMKSINFQIDNNDEESVRGAFYLALKNIGKQKRY